MQIKNLKLVNFRNYERLNLNFNEHLNLIIGQNGMGKTNLIEAIYVLALSKSFRTNVDTILIKENKNSLKIEGEIFENSFNNYELILNNEGKKVKINGTNQKRLSDYISKINVILFNPDDLRIIKDTPSIRRKMLNIEISQLDNLYLKYLQDYNKVVKQRNSYLKTMNINGNASTDYLDILTNKLIDIGLFLFNKRKEFIEKINESINDLFFKITKLDNLKIKYISDFNNMTKEELFKNYQKGLERDLMFGKTHLGIHHDDIVFELNEQNLKGYGSEGQQKNAIIALKLSEINIFYEKKKTYPILILDDLFSELDVEKVTNILNLLNKEIQTFITTTDIKNIGKVKLEDFTIFKVKEAQIEEVSYEK